MERYPIHHIHYSTIMIPKNDAFVAADDCEDAKKILLDYLKEHPHNKGFIKASMPIEEGFSCKDTGHTSHKKGLIDEILRGRY